MSKKKKVRKKSSAAKIEARRAERFRKIEKEKKRGGVFNKWPNGKLIHDCMVDASLKGDVRNYMVITGNRMVDYRGSHNLVCNGGSVGVGERTIIIHKKNLKNIIGDEVANRFWHPILGRLIDVVEGTKPKQHK